MTHAEQSRQSYLRNREAVHARCRAWRLANPERYREHVRAYVQKHRAQRTAYMRRYRADHPEWLRNKNRHIYARRRGAIGKHSPHHIRLIYESQSGLCYYCLIPLAGVFQIDHMVPLARGGTNWPSNLCCACGACNQAKRAMTADEFLAARAA